MTPRSLIRSKALSLALGCAALAGCTTAPSVPLPTVAAVDLQRYTGTWHEIAVVPNQFQSQCVADTQARYRVVGDGIEVLNRCRKADGSVDEITGTAKAVAGSGNAKLRVTFFWPFFGDYWVLALDPDYRWVLVGEPGRRFGWVLSRTPQMAPGELAVALARAEALGYERGAFKPTPQTRPLP